MRRPAVPRTVDIGEFYSRQACLGAAGEENLPSVICLALRWRYAADGYYRRSELQLKNMCQLLDFDLLLSSVGKEVDDDL